MQPFVDVDFLDRLRVGPLATYLDAYLKRIEGAGFLTSSAPMQLYAIARFSNWLQARQLDVCEVDEAAVERFLKRDPNVVRSGESAPLRRFLMMLRDMGLTPGSAPEPRNCRQQLIDEYEHYLSQERGLAKTSLLNYLPFAEQLLSDRFGMSEIQTSEITARDVTKFLRDRARQLSPGRAKLLVTALRSFLRYLRYQGKISVDLAGCVPSVAG
jgi:site-specific recombinase XerC